jgi:hypothetical protein
VSPQIECHTEAVGVTSADADWRDVSPLHAGGWSKNQQIM